MTGSHTINDGQRWFPFLNSSGEEIPPFSWVALSNAARSTQAAGYRVYAVGIKPAAGYTTHALTGPLKTPDGKHGDCTMDFPAWMAYDSADGTPANNTYYGPSAGAWIGKPGTGFFVLGALVSDETPKRVLVSKIGSVIVGKTDAAIAKGASGTISVYNDAADTTINITAYARLGAVAITKWVYVTQLPWGFEITNAEC